MLRYERYIKVTINSISHRGAVRSISESERLRFNEPTEEKKLKTYSNYSVQFGWAIDLHDKVDSKIKIC